MLKIFTSIALLFISVLSSAQLIQTLKGQIVDQALQQPISDATISIDGPIKKNSISEDDGSFRFLNLPLGAYTITVSHVGFVNSHIENIRLDAGKETVVTVSMEGKVVGSNEVTVKTSSKKNKPINEMSVVSARAFTVEETQRYAAAVNDPARMVTGFPGVVTTNDESNEIAIRGNAPNGLLWRMEGIDIPNPNHFSDAGSSGGGISILNAQLLANSDFLTGAFAAEYGNALSGVFDLRLRKGNNEKREYTLQAGMLGLNFAAEGPFKSGYKGSYLLNYRYSTLEVLNRIGIKLATGGTNFQDLSYNLYLPTKKLGDFTLFGFSGLSSEKINAEQDSSKWEVTGSRFQSDYKSITHLNGFTHTISPGSKTSLKSSIAFSYNSIKENEQYLENNYTFSDIYKDDFITKKWTVNSVLNHKLSNRSTLRTGVILNFMDFSYDQKSKDNPASGIKQKIKAIGTTATWQSYAQWQYKLTNNLLVNGGVHYLHSFYNQSSSLEPRASVKWNTGSKSSVSLGYGLHSQIQPVGVLFATDTIRGNLSFINKQLGFTKAHHYVLSYSYSLADNIRLKAEAYYQQLFNVPVSKLRESSFSTLNIQNDYITEELINKGKGKNYGLELSLDKNLSNHFYYTLSTTVYQSKYTASDGIERNTRYNGNYINNVVAGKEFVWKEERKAFGVNLKLIHAGGLRTTPIDKEKSQQQGYTVYKNKEAYSLQNPAYFRTDIRLSMKWNRIGKTSTLSLDIQNLTNRFNVYNQRYNIRKGEIIYNYQNGLIPVLNYKLEL